MAGPAPGLRSASIVVALLLTLFAATLALATLDLASDLAEGARWHHVLAEGSVALLGAIGAAWATRRLAQSLQSARSAARAAALAAEGLRRDLGVSRADAERWREEAAALLRGLGEAIDRQFERWGLTPAERGVALLLLKGLSHKEIAGVRGVAEHTVRQQAQVVYRKAHVMGRHDLAAFFLEDLLAPPAEGSPP